MRQSPPPSPPAVDHPGAGCVNPDASRFAAAGNGGDVRPGGSGPCRGGGSGAPAPLPACQGVGHDTGTHLAVWTGAVPVLYGATVLPQPIRRRPATPLPHLLIPKT